MAHIMRNIHIIVITTAGRIVDLTGHHFAFIAKYSNGVYCLSSIMQSAGASMF